MSNLSDLLGSGSSAGTITAVASGALANGDKVILQSDGTVKVVGIEVVSESIPLGSVSIIDSTNGRYEQVKFHPTDEGKFVVIWRDGNGYGRAVVGTVSGSSVTLGTSVVFSSTSNDMLAFDIDPNDGNTLVIGYRAGTSSTSSKAIVGTISGTSISFGSAVTLSISSGGWGNKFDVKFDPNTAGKFILKYLWDNYPNSRTKVTVGEVSSNSISFGSHYNVSNTHLSDCHRSCILWDKNDADKVVIIYSRNDYPASYDTVHARVGTLTGTSISWGSETTVESTNSNTYFAGAFSDTQGKFVVTHKNNSDTTSGGARICTVSGTSITVGSNYIFSTSQAYYRDVEFVPNTETFVVFYNDWGDLKYGAVKVGTVSGTSISWGSEVIIQNKLIHGYEGISISMDPNNGGKFIMGYFNTTDYNCEVIFGQVAANVPNLTSDNFIGISDGAYANGATATIQVTGSTDDAQSGLTVGSKHYVQNDGSLSTTADDPSVVAGLALSSTNLLIKKR